MAEQSINNILPELHEIIQNRLHADPKSSYVASLKHKGLDAILKKIGEEATETVMAAKDGEQSKIVYEMADLWFHSLVLLADQGLHPDQVLAELASRFGQSGIEEKKQRDDQANNKWSITVYNQSNSTSLDVRGTLWV